MDGDESLFYQELEVEIDIVRWVPCLQQSLTEREIRGCMLDERERRVDQ